MFAVSPFCFSDRRVTVIYRNIPLNNVVFFVREQLIYNQMLAELQNVRWHDLRRTFGSDFVMATKDLMALQQLLGHSNYQTTKTHYAHLIDERIVNAMDVFEKKVSV